MHFLTDLLTTIRGLGESFVEVLRAELGAFKGDLRQSGRLALRGVKLVVVAMLLAFWLIGLIAFALVAFLAPGVGYGVAALIVGGGFLLVVLALGLWARSTFRQVQGPGKTAQRHVRDHVEWIKGELAISEDAETKTGPGERDEPN